MGERARRDPAGHQQRGKGKPTPAAPQNTPEPGATPATRMVVWVQGVSATIDKHPEIADDILGLHLLIPGGLLTARLPIPAGWDALVDAVETARAERSDAVRAAGAGIHLPAGVDIDAEAAARQALREGPNHAG